MSKLRTLLKALIISVKIKGVFSMAISLLGFAAAFLPVIIAEQLRALTDSLQALMGTGGSANPSLAIFAGLIGLYVTQVIITNIQQYTYGLDEVKIQRYIKRTIMRHKCEVRYKYIENHDDFQKRLAFIEEYAGYHMAKYIGNMITILQLIIAFVVAALALWKISLYIVLILFVTSIPAALLSISSRMKHFAAGQSGWKKVHWQSTTFT